MGGEVRKSGGTVIVCRCEDVTADDIREAIELGIDDFELLRRYLKIGFGPCQGRSCVAIAARIFAKATGRKIDEVLSNYRVRPPIVPVPAKYFTRGDRT